MRPSIRGCYRRLHKPRLLRFVQTVAEYGNVLVVKLHLLRAYFGFLKIRFWVFSQTCGVFAKYIITISANNGSLCYVFLNTFVVNFTKRIINSLKRKFISFPSV